MTRDESDTLGIASRCRQPDPLVCYERLTSCEQTCLCCPVASWMTIVEFKGRGANDSVALEEPAFAAQ
jgi:hypothetical protein